jgi:hypothetical protein
MFRVQTGRIQPRSTGKSSVTISAEPDGAAAVSQVRIKGRFIVRADEKLTAFLGAERAVHQFAVSLLS